jgi:glycosyltransferase involved in cell wall biosynthesis
VQPLKVLDLRDTYEIGGPGKTILETYKAIDASRFDLHLGVFLTRDETDDAPFITAAKAIGMPVHIIRGFNQYDPRMVQQVAGLVDKLGIDIIHSHEPKSDVIAYLASKVRRVSIITTLHGWIANSAKRRFLVHVDEFFVKYFDRVIAVSGPIHHRMVKIGLREDQLVLVHNAIVLENYQRTGRCGFVAQLTGQQVERPLLASIGRISREKGHEDLVDALAIVAARGFKVSAVIAGDGPLRSALVDRVRARGLQDSVHLPGYVNEPQHILEETDLMVLPSHTEGLPNAALEALAMEVPVLATRVGGTPDVIKDGETGRLVESRSPEDLAAGILEFLSDRLAWKQMACRGRRMVAERFDFRARTRALEAIYTELALSGSRAKSDGFAA